MKCITCEHELDSTMKHALSMNSCPFCGKNVFNNAEFDFRKSIYRILIKNGLEDEDIMSKIVDDISNSLRQHIESGEEAKAEDESEKEVSLEEDEDDGLGNAPSRKLTPNPNKTVAAEVKPNHIDNAMRVWEKAQRIDDDDNITHAQDGADADDIPFFSSTSNEANAKADALKQKAPARPGFKSKPTPKV